MPKWETKFIQQASDKALAKCVCAALSSLFRKNRYLLEADVNERSISHRLALYLEKEFPDWDVDCEYNRDGHEPKRLQLDPELVRSDDEQGTTVYPDIIIHKRGGQQNHLAIEIKKSSGSNGNKDLWKLKALKKQLNYRYGLFLRLGTGNEVGLTEFQWTDP